MTVLERVFVGQCEVVVFLDFVHFFFFFFFFFSPLSREFFFFFFSLGREAHRAANGVSVL